MLPCLAVIRLEARNHDASPPIAPPNRSPQPPNPQPPANPSHTRNSLIQPLSGEGNRRMYSVCHPFSVTEELRLNDVGLAWGGPQASPPVRPTHGTISAPGSSPSSTTTQLRLFVKAGTRPAGYEAQASGTRLPKSVSLFLSRLTRRCRRWAESLPRWTIAAATPPFLWRTLQHPLATLPAPKDSNIRLARQHLETLPAKYHLLPLHAPKTLSLGVGLGVQDLSPPQEPRQRLSRTGLEMLTAALALLPSGRPKHRGGSSTQQPRKQPRKRARPVSVLSPSRPLTILAPLPDGIDLRGYPSAYKDAETQTTPPLLPIATTSCWTLPSVRAFDVPAAPCDEDWIYQDGGAGTTADYCLAADHTTYNWVTSVQTMAGQTPADYNTSKRVAEAASSESCSLLDVELDGVRGRGDEVYSRNGEV